MLLSCSNDCTIKVWEVDQNGDPAMAISNGVGEEKESGNEREDQAALTISHHTESVTAVAWMPDGRRFVSASMDRTVVLWDLEGIMLAAWKGKRVGDLVVSSCGKRLLLTCAENAVVQLHVTEKKTPSRPDSEGTCYQLVHDGEQVT
ncbi:unnamed protein product [Chrysoparadoxa australica]